MRKKILSLLFTLVLILVLGSCHRGSNRLASLNLPETFDETREYNISFWAKNDGNTEQVRVYNEAIEKFEKIYPNINVEIRHFSSYPDIYRDVLVNIATDGESYGHHTKFVENSRCPNRRRCDNERNDNGL